MIEPSAGRSEAVHNPEVSEFPKNLSFDQLLEAHALAERTFRVEANGITAATGEIILPLGLRGERLEITSGLNARGGRTHTSQKLIEYIINYGLKDGQSERSLLLRNGSTDPNQLVEELKKMVLEAGPKLGIYLKG